MSNQADVVIRLIAKDEGLKKALKEAGPAGEKAMRQIERAGKKAAPGLKAVDNVAKDLKSSMSGLLDRLGPFGSALRGLGPIGAGVGITLGALAAGALAASSAGAEAARSIAAIGDEAEKLSLTTDQYQGLSFAASKLRIEQSELNSAVQTANKTLAEAALGTGEFFSNLNQLNPEMVKSVQEADSLEARLAAISKAYSEASTETERNTIKTRTFGDNGLRAGEALLTMENGLSGVIAEAKRAGVVFSVDLIQSSQEAAAAIAEADKKIEASKLRLKVAFQDFSVSSKESLASFFTQAASFGAAKSLEDEVFKVEQARNRLIGLVSLKGNDVPPVLQPLLGIGFSKKLEGYKAQLADLDQQIAGREQRKSFAIFPEFEGVSGPEDESNQELSANLQASLNRLREEAKTAADRQVAALKDLDAARAAGALTSDKEYNRLRALITEKYKDVDAIRAAQKAEQDARQASAALAQAQSKAAEIRASLGDQTGVLAAKTKELNTLVKQGVLDQSEADTALQNYTNTLTGASAAQDKLLQAFTQTLDPVARFNQETEALNALQKIANLDGDKFNAILQSRAALLADIETAQREAAERDSFDGETLGEAEQRILDSLKSTTQIIDEKVALERKITDALVSQGALTSGEAQQRLAEYQEELTKTEAATNRLGLAQTDLQGLISASTNGWDAFGQAGLKVLEQLILKMLQFDSLGQGGSFLSILGSGLAGAFGGNSGVSGLSATNNSVSVPVFHGGTASVGSGSPVRRAVNPSLFTGAPRFHQGVSNLGSDEYAAILQKEERVFSASDNRALIMAINGKGGGVMMAPPMSVTVINNGSQKVETEEREGANGERELLVTVSKMIEKGTLQTLRSPRGKRAMQSEYGIKPKLGSA